MGVKISELNEALSVQNSDVLPIVQNGETKKIQVETLGSQKVNKSGDTLTGALSFNNTNSYEAIIKDRTINNVNYRAKLGVGDNGSVRLELNEGSSTSGTSLEVRTNGLYNGLSGQKLLEIKTKTINNAPVNNYGNVDLGLSASSAMVLGVNFARGDCNSIPFINANHWYCYVVINQAQNVINLHQSGTVTTTVYYVEF